MIGQYEILPQVGSLAAAAVTGTTAATAITLVTLSRRSRLLVFTNTLDTDVMLTYNGADMLRLPAGNPAALDFTSDVMFCEVARVVGVYYPSTSTIPTTGNLSASCF